MKILHRAKRINNEEVVEGYLKKMGSGFHIVDVVDENKTYQVREESIVLVDESGEDNKVREMLHEMDLLTSIKRCMLRYCNSHGIERQYENEMRDLLSKYEDKINDELLNLTGKSYEKQTEELRAASQK